MEAWDVRIWRISPRYTFSTRSSIAGPLPGENVERVKTNCGRCSNHKKKSRYAEERWSVILAPSPASVLSKPWHSRLKMVEHGRTSGDASLRRDGVSPQRYLDKAKECERMAAQVKSCEATFLTNDARHWRDLAKQAEDWDRVRGVMTESLHRLRSKLLPPVELSD
jgi:hypothetical protein